MAVKKAVAEWLQVVEKVRDLRVEAEKKFTRWRWSCHWLVIGKHPLTELRPLSKRNVLWLGRRVGPKVDSRQRTFETEVVGD